MDSHTTSSKMAPMSEEENEIMGHLAAAVVIFSKLESTHPQHDLEFTTAIHQAQRVVTQRMCQREFPGSYPTYVSEIKVNSKIDPKSLVGILDKFTEHGKPALKVCELRIPGKPGTKPYQGYQTDNELCQGEGYQDCDTCAIRDPELIEKKDCDLYEKGKPGTMRAIKPEYVKKHESYFCIADGYKDCNICALRHPKKVEYKMNTEGRPKHG